jgi:hypothetical protein
MRAMFYDKNGLSGNGSTLMNLELKTIILIDYARLQSGGAQRTISLILLRFYPLKHE